MKYRQLAAALLALTVTALLTGGCAPVSAGTVKVTAAAVTEKPLDPVLTLEGVLLPAETAVVSSRVSGQLDSVLAKPGDAVTAGQLLATLDSRALKAQLQQAEAGLQTAQAARDMSAGQAEMARIAQKGAETDYQRVQALHEAGAASQSQLEAAADKLETARVQARNAQGPAGNQAAASVATAAAALESMRTQLDYTRLTSPLDGVVTVRSAELGETVAPGTAVMTVARMDVLRIKGVVPQELLASLKVGQAVPVTAAVYPEAPLPGRLTVLGPTAVNTGELFPVEIEVPNDGRLLAGMSASASLKAEGRRGLTVPAAAVMRESGRRFVYVLSEGVAHRTEVLPGRTLNGETEILKGLKAGDQVAVAGAGSLRDGAAVALQE